MQSKTSKKMLWAGRIVSALPVLFLVMDGAMKVTSPNMPVIVESSVHLGLPVSQVFGLGVLLLSCVAVYAIPRTSVLGAVLLTGYLGGAVAIHVRVGDPLFSHVLFPVYVAVLLWGGLFLRDERVRALLSARRGEGASRGSPSRSSQENALRPADLGA